MDLLSVLFYILFVVVVVTDLRSSSVERFALSCFLEVLNLGLARLWPRLDGLGTPQ